MVKEKVVIDPGKTDDSLYSVIMKNDDVTPFNYVVDVLREIFEYTIEDAVAKMFAIHRLGPGGQAVVGVYSMERAYELVDLVDAKNNEEGELLQTFAEKV